MSVAGFEGIAMRWLRVHVGCTALILGLFKPAVALEPSSTTLVVESDRDRISLSVPVSRVTVSLPRGDLRLAGGSRTGSAQSPRYFRFDDVKHGIIVSGWFESADHFAGFERFWNSELQSMKKNGVAVKGTPEIVRIGPWTAAVYEVDVGTLTGVNTHLRSELIEAGTWVDLHVSVTGNTSAQQARRVARQFLEDVAVSERP